MVSLLIWLSRTLKVGCQRSEDCYLLWPVLKVDHWGLGNTSAGQVLTAQA